MKIYMISTPHCPRCEAAIKTLQSSVDSSILEDTDRFEKLVFPNDNQAVEIAQRLQILLAPVFVIEESGDYKPVELKEVIELLNS